MKFYKAPWQILICFISTFCLTLINPAYSQEELLSVGSEGEMTILGGTDFNIDKLVIKPQTIWNPRKEQKNHYKL